MEEEEVEKRLREQAPGYFLIRFSISRADSGFFVLAVKVDGDAIQVQLEVSTRVVTMGGNSGILSFYFNCVVVYHISGACNGDKRLGKYPPLFTDTAANKCFRIYNTSLIEIPK